MLGESPGLTVSRIALGCGNFGGVGSAPEFFGRGLTEDEAFALMDAAWAAGIDWFDTADAYGGGRSERAIGRWMAARGVRPRLTTKTFNPMEAGADHGLKPDRVARQLRSSLDRLGVGQVQLHRVDPEPVQAGPQLAGDPVGPQAVVGPLVHRVVGLGGQPRPDAAAADPLADRLLAAAAAVGVGGVEIGDARLPGGVHQLKRLVLAQPLAEEGGRRAHSAEVAAAKCDPRQLQGDHPRHSIKRGSSRAMPADPPAVSVSGAGQRQWSSGTGPRDCTVRMTKVLRASTTPGTASTWSSSSRS